MKPWGVKESVEDLLSGTPAHAGSGAVRDRSERQFLNRAAERGGLPLHWAGGGNCWVTRMDSTADKILTAHREIAGQQLFTKAGEP